MKVEGAWEFEASQITIPKHQCSFLVFRLKLLYCAVKISYFPCKSLFNSLRVNFKNSTKLIKKELRSPGWRFFSSLAFRETKLFFFFDIFFRKVSTIHIACKVISEKSCMISHRLEDDYCDLSKASFSKTSKNFWD